MYTPYGTKLKIFVKESSNVNEVDKNRAKKFDNFSPLAGEKAKEFYENILKEPSFSQKTLIKRKNSGNCNNKTEIACKQMHEQQRNFKNLDLLLMAQNNDIKNLKIFLSQKQSFDINIVDNFDWTPLMCASYSGAEDAVKILLQNGADPNKSDKLGNTPLSLAKRRRFKNIVTLLENNFNSKEEKLEVKSPKSFFCVLCKKNFTLNKKDHETSIVHQFNKTHKTSTFYGIPENNKGFQMLLKNGWNKEHGLGPHGNGCKFPVKAVVKNNRTGVGASDFLNDTKKHQLMSYLKCKNRKVKLLKMKNEKEFEKNFRLEFS